MGLRIPIYNGHTLTFPIDPSPLLISLATTCVATAVTFLLGMYAAWRMYSMRGSFRGWVDGILTLPLVLPPTVVGFFLLVLLGRRSFIGHALEQIGIVIVFSWPATVIAATVVAFPLMYRTTLGAFEQVNPNLLDAARTLGASESRIFRRVLLPMAAPGVLAGTVLAFARALGEFGATLMLAGNIPGRTQTMPMAIFSAAASGEMGSAFFWVILIVVLSLAIIRLLHWEWKTKKAPAFAENPQWASTPEPDLASFSPFVAAEPKPDFKLEIRIEKSLDPFNLNVQFIAGKGAVGLLGASGAGKTMTLRIIAGIVKPDHGRIALNGRVLYDGAAGQNIQAARRRIGVVFQDYALFPRMTVAENIGFGLGALSSEDRRLRVSRQLDRMHIAELANRYPAEISGGQRQRVAIARCMAIEPEALLFDEPFAALDPHLRRQMEEQLRETLADYNGAVIFVTHDMEEAFRFCTELLVLDRGRVIASGPKHRLFENPRTVAAARLTGCKNIVPARRIAADRVAVDTWNCQLRVAQHVPDALTHLGVRSHQIALLGCEGENTFSCWLVGTSEAPHEVTLYLRLHAAPQPGDLPHVQADIPKDLWRVLSAQPQPWRIGFDPERILMLEERTAYETSVSTAIE
jgi:molybdate transport system permease protein